MEMQSISKWGLFPIPPHPAPVSKFIEGTHHAVTVNQAHERYRKIMFGLRASMPDATEWHMQHIGYAIEAALESPKVKEALQYMMDKDTIASVAEGVDICV